jgi:hypothetical protein
MTKPAEKTNFPFMKTSTPRRSGKVFLDETDVKPSMGTTYATPI